MVVIMQVLYAVLIRIPGQDVHPQGVRTVCPLLWIYQGASHFYEHLLETELCQITIKSRTGHVIAST